MSVLMTLLFAGLTVQPGLGLGVGYLDQSAGLELRLELAMSDKDWNLRLAAPLRGLMVPEFRFRHADWDELGDYSALVESLKWGDDEFLSLIHI